MKEATFKPIGHVERGQPVRVGENNRILWYEDDITVLYSDDKDVSFTLGDDTTYSLEYYKYEYYAYERTEYTTKSYKPWYGFGFITKERTESKTIYEPHYFDAVKIDTFGETKRLLLKEVEL
jgi:hypothetical protein